VDLLEKEFFIYSISVLEQKLSDISRFFTGEKSISQRELKCQPRERVMRRIDRGRERERGRGA
jgi:hypothetical protein